MDKLVLIDGNSLINRAYYALPVLTNSEGEFCNALYGFSNIIIKIITEIKPKYMAVAFDLKYPTFRHKMFKEYKGTRKQTPPELIEQIENLKQLLKTMKIKVLELKGYEADDLIGTMAKRYKEETIIVSGDKDLLQLIDDTTNVWLTKKGITEILNLNESGLKEFMNVSPKQIIDLKSLMGDSSDNIPGVAGIGEKTATNLINEYGSMVEVYNHIDEIKGKLKEKLIEGKENAKLSYELATINIDAPIDCKIEECLVEFPFNNDTYEAFEHYEFKTILNRENLFLETVKQETLKKINLIKITTKEKLEELISQINTVDLIGLNINNNINISLSKYQEYEIIIKDADNNGLDYEETLYALKSILESEKVKKVCYFSKQQMHLLNKMRISLNGLCFDVNLAIYLLNGSKKTSDEMNDFLLGVNYPEYARASALLYAYDLYLKQLEEENMSDLYFNIEFPLINVLFDMEISGFKINKKILEELNKNYEVEIANLTQEIYKTAGEEINLNSPKQLSELLFNKLGLPSPKKQSTSVEVLEKLSNLHPIINMILRYRKIMKINNTYLESFKKLVDKENLIHTVFHQTLTATGRLSSTEPNLQNIPIREEEGKLLRKLFISRFENGYLVTADYSQIELRLMAHYSKDKKLVEAFNNNIDIHTKTASEVFNVPVDSVSNEMRRDAKAVNFGILYGISDFGLAENLKIPVKEAKEYIEAYFTKFKDVKKYIDNAVEETKKTGYSVTLFGRKRKVDEINSSDYQTRQFGIRVAMNMPLQGSASDIIKIAMVNVFKRLKNEGLKSKLILQIHDELIVDTMPDELEKVKNILKEEMENVTKLEVPLLVDIEHGKDWFEAK